MPEPYVIRLRAPWEVSAAGEGFRLVRSFHAPTGLTERSRVCIVSPLEVDQLVLNNQTVAPNESGRFDVTSLLLRRNVLTLVIHCPVPPADFEVRLEIDEA